MIPRDCVVVNSKVYAVEPFRVAGGYILKFLHRHPFQIGHHFRDVAEVCRFVPVTSVGYGGEVGTVGLKDKSVDWGFGDDALVSF